MLSNIFKVLKKIITCMLIIYAYDSINLSSNIIIPINVITVLIVYFFGIFGIVGIIILSFLL